MDTLTNRELLLETEMLTNGAARTWKQIEKARDKEQESGTNYGKRLIAGAVEQFGVAVAEFCQQKGSGRRHTVIAVLLPLDSKVVAFLTLQSVVDSIMKQKAHTRACVLLGKRIEDELRFTTFKQENKAFWETIMKDLVKREPNIKRRRTILIHEMKKGAETQPALRWVAWDDTKRLHVGAKCIELLEASTGLVQKKVLRVGRKTIAALEATPDTIAFVKELAETKSGLLSPMYLPTIIPPKPWTGPITGGYHLKQLRPIPLVKVYGDRGRAYLQKMMGQTNKMRLVYEAVNAVQATPWKVNQAVLEVMLTAWKAGLEVGDMPSQGEIPLPPKPLDIADNEVSRKEWSRKASTIHNNNAKRRSQVIQAGRLVWLGEKFAPEAAIYFPMQLDFRGRMYAIPPTLNPQGNDLAKALLTFAKGKALGESGWRWLHIHIANVWGEDKVSLDERFEWTAANYHWIVDCVAQPFEHRRWMDADKPWQFLAGAQELVAAVESGNYEAFVSSLPISVDGTCNGLQHFSAMLLDEQGAKAVNLSPSVKPQDIYQAVADRVRERLTKLAAEGEVMAAQWLQVGFDRKATKRAVMIVPYSGTLFAAKQYTIDYLTKRTDVTAVWGDDKFAPALYFAKHVWAAIAETIVSAKQVMGWLRKISDAVSKHGENGSPVSWVTPVGFPVVQDYREMDSYQVESCLKESVRYRPRLERETITIDARAMNQAISPNVIHSLDAACLMLTVCRAADEGIECFAMVHDSYGVLAGDMEVLYTGLRQAFVDIYQHDVMQDFYNAATVDLSDKEKSKIPAMPTKGSFQLESVKESKYFFA